jgi:hypothetical protein
MRVLEEIIGRLPYLTESQLGRLEDELRRERQRRASSAGGGGDASYVQEHAAPPLTEVLSGFNSPVRKPPLPAGD